MKRRQYLTKSVKLQGESDGKSFERTFTIVRVISSGADGVCYEAYHEKSGKGVLKEFYPDGLIGFERLGDGSLVHSTEFRKSFSDFVRTREDFLKPYEMLLKLKQQDKGGDLSTFIPAFELYYGEGKDNEYESTVYVWTPDPELYTFSKMCEEIHKHPDDKPERKLFIVLKSIETLTKCICALHGADIIHRDIKPSNFGFRRRGDETLTQSISMFDLDSLCSLWSEQPGVIGTKGYMEMEARREKSNNQTDIYSIGATLFTAIIDTKETRESGYLYSPEFYPRLAEMVRESELIKASERNSDPRLRNILCTILRRALSPRPRRYDCCEELLEDLEKALFYILPPEIARKNRAGAKWVLEEAEKSMDTGSDRNVSLAMMCHLFEHPLYECAGEEDGSLGVVIAGLGRHGQKFIDACLQAGQIPGKSLTVYIITENDLDREVYLSERPQLEDFFDIETAASEPGESNFIKSRNPDPYGRLVFDYLDAAAGEGDFRKAVAGQIRKIAESLPAHYIFIDLGDTDMDAGVASMCRKIRFSGGRQCVVTYAAEETLPEKAGSARNMSPQARARIVPLYVSEDIRKTDIYSEIERMAFNVHLIWEKNLNLDFNLIKKDFRKPYNLNSCISNVVSLKYRLHSLGIDLDKLSFEEAADKYEQIILRDKNAEDIRNEMVWLEHRRWVTEKLCGGWSEMSIDECCRLGETKDEKSKKHVCIVRSRPDMLLTDGDLDWDKASDDEIGALDDLDKLSVELHRAYARLAGKTRRKSLHANPSLTEMRNIAESRELGSGSAGLRAAFGEWFECIKAIWNGDDSRVRMYKGLKNEFLRQAENLDEETHAELEQAVNSFESFFRPVLASEEYTDWKLNDAANVDNIPFVLTYSEKIFLVIPFNAGTRPEDLFSDVAAATCVNPEKVLYLYQVKSARDVDALEKALSRVSAYMKGKMLKGDLEFIIVCDDSNVTDRQLTDAVTGAGGEMRKIIRDGSGDANAEELKKYLRDAGRGKYLFALERNRTKLSARLEKSGFYDDFGWYRVDPVTLAFETGNGAGELRFINKMPHITPADLTALTGLPSEGAERPEYAEYHEVLWQRYSEDMDAWKQLCVRLGEISREKDIVAVFTKGHDAAARKPDMYRYILPAVCSAGAAKVVEGLKDAKMIGKDSVSAAYLSDSFEVRIYDPYSRKERFDRLFSDVYALAAADSITVRTLKSKKKDRTEVICDYLTVTVMKDELEDLNEELLQFLSDIGCIIMIDTPEGAVITFGSGKIKKLLTDPNRILALQMYHAAKVTGEFNDAVIYSGAYDGQEGEIAEPVCVLTKGMKSYFVSCSEAAIPEEDDPDADICEEALHRDLKLFAEKYGVNAVPLVLYDLDFEEELLSRLK